MENSISSKVYKTVLFIFSICWISFISLDYFQKHPGYLMNAKVFNFWGLYAAVILICIALSILVIKYKSKFIKFSRGISLYLFSLFLVCITFISATNAADEVANTGTLNIENLASFIFLFLKVSAFLLIILCCCYATGNLFTKSLKVEFSKNSKRIIELGIGIMLLVMICFVLGIFKVLYAFVLWPIVLFLIGFNWRNSLDFIKTLFWDPLKISKKMNPFGVFCLLFLTYLVGINLMQNLTPWPKGWDSLSLYVNLPNLIQEYHGLVKGFQPYNWSLFMSLGALLFNSIETTLSLSFAGGILCLFALYPLAKNVFKLDINYSLLICLLFYLIPTVSFQSFLEQKVDLGLLFIILIIINILMKWSLGASQKKAEINQKNEQIEEAKTLFFDKYLVIAGLLTGFAFGIKLTTLFTYFGVIAMIWFLNMGSLAFICVSLMSLFGILLVKLDDMSGMRAHHLSSNLVQWFLLAGGIGFLVYLFMKHRKQLIKSLMQTVVYSLFFGLMVIPWLGKNFVDAGNKISFNYLLNGKSNAPTFDLNRFEQKWQENNNTNGQNNH